jgi:hypothetical protein
MLFHLLTTLPLPRVAAMLNLEPSEEKKIRTTNLLQEKVSDASISLDALSRSANARLLELEITA